MEQLTRLNLEEVYQKAYTGHTRARVERLFQEYFQERLKREGPQGGSTPLTALRTRWDHITNAITGQSREIDFNIALGQAIEVLGVNCVLGVGANTAIQQSMEVLVDLDGPALAGNSISNATLFLARSVLESVIANFEHSSDILTSGGATTSVLQNYTFPLPILTARNLGIADLAVVSTGVALTGIQHRVMMITSQENLMLFALGRA